MDEPTGTPVIRAPVNLARNGPAVKLRRPHCLDARHRSGKWSFTCLLRPDDLLAAVLKCLRPKGNSLPYEAFSNPAIVGRVPELPVRPDEWLPAIKSIWNPAMSLYPIVPEVSERRKINNPLLIHSLRSLRIGVTGASAAGSASSPSNSSRTTQPCSLMPAGVSPIASAKRITCVIVDGDASGCSAFTVQ